MVKKSCQKAFIARMAALGIVSMAGVANAAAPLPGWDGSLPEEGNPLTSQDYQDFTVYSLNYLTQLAEKNTDTSDPFYGLVKQQSYNYATTGATLPDDIVVMTNNVNATVASNLDTCGGTAAGSGCDNAYGYTSSSEIYNVTNNDTEPSVVVPGEDYGDPTTTLSTWTATPDALVNYLDGGDLTFIFNLNEQNGGDANELVGQSLLVSVKIDLTDVDGNVLVSFYVGANNAIGLACTAEEVWMGTGACTGLGPLGEPEADPTNVYIADTTDPDYPASVTDGSEDNEFYNPDAIVDTRDFDPTSNNGFISTDPRWAYVHGAISVHSVTGAFLGMGDCTFTGYDDCQTVNQNLGRNEAAFAAYSKELSDLIYAGFYEGVEIAFMNIDVFTSGQDNGFEQVAIIATHVDRTVDEPGTLAIIALGLLAMGVRKRRVPARRISG